MSDLRIHSRIQSAEFLVSAGRPDQFPRGPYPEIAFAGRSNVGKSSMINRLLGRRDLARTSGTPGRTRTINFYQVNDRFRFVDLPGYGYAPVSRVLKEAWWDLVEGYLRERSQLRGVVHILDARHVPTAQDQELTEFLTAVGLPYCPVMTKGDKLARGQHASARAAVARTLGHASAESLILFSATTGQGVADLWREIETQLAAPPRDAPGSPQG